jgi:hypothetical protein
MDLDSILRGIKRADGSNFFDDDFIESSKSIDRSNRNESSSRGTSYNTSSSAGNKGGNQNLNAGGQYCYGSGGRSTKSSSQNNIT